MLLVHDDAGTVARERNGRRQPRWTRTHHRHGRQAHRLDPPPGQQLPARPLLTRRQRPCEGGGRIGPANVIGASLPPMPAPCPSFEPEAMGQAPRGPLAQGARTSSDAPQNAAGTACCRSRIRGPSEPSCFGPARRETPCRRPHHAPASFNPGGGARGVLCPYARDLASRFGISE